MKPSVMIPTMVGILAIIGAVFGAYQYIDGKYALAEDVKKVEKRLDYKIISDQLNSTQQRIWTIQDRFQKTPMDSTTKEELRTLEMNKEQLKQKIDTMEKDIK